MAGDYATLATFAGPCDYGAAAELPREARRLFSPARGRWPRLPAGDLVPPVEAVKLPGPVELAKLARAGLDFLFIFSSVKVLAENHK